MKLIFVYNANSGKWDACLDSLHKIASPKTYPCSLCGLTYGVFKIRPEWKVFKENSGLNLVFHHIDEFNKEYPDFKNRFKYPVILKENHEGLSMFISKEKLDALTTESNLINLINSKIKIP